MQCEMIYTRHARLRMAQRNITEGKVETVFREYHTALPGRDGATNYYRIIAGRRIRVTLVLGGCGPNIQYVVIKTVTEEEL